VKSIALIYLLILIALSLLFFYGTGTSNPPEGELNDETEEVITELGGNFVANWYIDAGYFLFLRIISLIFYGLFILNRIYKSELNYQSRLDQITREQIQNKTFQRYLVLHESVNLAKSKLLTLTPVYFVLLGITLLLAMFIMYDLEQPMFLALLALSVFSLLFVSNSFIIHFSEYYNSNNDILPFDNVVENMFEQF